ncbi:hypothetical protein J6590_019531 [Homalodisca vitripennis]|nr:hypothetical protein J6590_019531 [Homalodisca vitripennis]
MKNAEKFNEVWSNCFTHLKPIIDPSYRTSHRITNDVPNHDKPVSASWWLFYRKRANYCCPIMSSTHTSLLRTIECSRCHSQSIIKGSSIKNGSSRRFSITTISFVEHVPLSAEHGGMVICCLKASKQEDYSRGVLLQSKG